ncbi:NAD(P)H-binding protein [Myroides odoratimimus]|uniref:NAD(P)H-binding protein n=1 Tax=Myroides odoratimimus TaxID=76832 RepID=UPI002DBDFBCB|nr:NAD(P)H-binding protein [Myroides odoratimimus]MEC4051560.1 NAD(P)H-binding protein [Myroides odoratimimus]
MKALVIGGTGATGKVLVRQLLCDDDFHEVVIFIRKEWDIQHPKLVVHLVDFEQIDQWKHLIAGDVAFSCLGTTLKQAGSKQKQWHIDYDYVMQFAQYAKGNGVTNFVLLSAKAASDKSAFFYSRLKGTLERSVLNLSFENTIILRPGLLLRPGTNRMGERIAAKVLFFFNKMRLFMKYKPIEVVKVANRMRREAKNYCCRRLIIESNEI